VQSCRERLGGVVPFHAAMRCSPAASACFSALI
jgi:hypothetical protein